MIRTAGDTNVARKALLVGLNCLTVSLPGASSASGRSKSRPRGHLCKTGKESIEDDPEDRF
jgi:hypothetical protein